jgi:PAS domain S-box-containing protein
MVIYAENENYFNDKKVKILTDLSADLSHANAKIMSEKIAIKRQKELLESERRWKIALDSTNEGVWISYLDIKKTFYSDKWKEMLGYNIAEIPTKLDVFYNLMHPDDIEEHKRIIENCKKGLIDNIENIVRLRAKDGSYRWILVRGKVYKYDSNGKPKALIGTHTDITELNEINEKLMKLNNFYEALLFSNRVLMNEESIEKLFHEICKIAVEYGKLLMARVAVVDKKSENFNQVALYIKDDRCLDYLEEIKKANNLEVKKQDGARRAYDSNDVIIINDFENDDSVSYFRKAAKKAGIKSAVAFPVLYKDSVYAVFTLYAGEKNYFD